MRRLNSILQTPNQVTQIDLDKEVRILYGVKFMIVKMSSTMSLKLRRMGIQWVSQFTFLRAKAMMKHNGSCLTKMDGCTMGIIASI